MTTNTDKQAVARLFEDVEKVRAGIERDLPHILAKGFANLLVRNSITIDSERKEQNITNHQVKQQT